MSILESGKALERIKRLASRAPRSSEHAVLNGIAEAIIEVGEDSIPIWLEQENQTALDVRER